MASNMAFVFRLHVPCDKTFTIGTVNFDILTSGFDDDGYFWNLPRTGAFVFITGLVIITFCDDTWELLSEPCAF